MNGVVSYLEHKLAADHQNLAVEIEVAQKDRHFDRDELSLMKRKKLDLKDQLVIERQKTADSN